MTDFYLGSEVDSTLPPEPMWEPAKCQAGLCQALKDIIHDGIAGKCATHVAEFPNRVDRCLVDYDNEIMVLMMPAVWCCLVNDLRLFQADGKTKAF